MESQDLAKMGEDAAVEYLSELGYEILARNFHFGRNGEIDIIAKNGEYTVFAEVKTRQWGKPEHALLSITASKQRQIVRIARGYMFINGMGELNCRFDVLTVTFQRGRPIVTHFPNAFFSRE